MQATPRLSEDKVKQCVDPKLNNEYPPKAIAKVVYSLPNPCQTLALFSHIILSLIILRWQLLQHFVFNTRQISAQTWQLSSRHCNHYSMQNQQEHNRMHRYKQTQHSSFKQKGILQLFYYLWQIICFVFFFWSTLFQHFAYT